MAGKVPAAKPDDLSSTPEATLGGGEQRTHTTPSSYSLTCTPPTYCFKGLLTTLAALPEDSRFCSYHLHDG